jgi:hypothetical protein
MERSAFIVSSNQQNMIEDLLATKQQEFARSLAKAYDSLVAQAMEAKGYPLDESYIREHMGKQSPYHGLDRFYHDGILFLEITTTFDYSDPMKIRATQTPILY